MDLVLLFYNEVENYLFCSCQADAMAPTFVHRWLLFYIWLSQNGSHCILVIRYKPSYNHLAESLAYGYV